MIIDKQTKDTIINVTLVAIFILLGLRGVGNLAKNYKIENTVRNTKKIRVAIEEYYQKTGVYPELTKAGANMDLAILDFKMENGEIISFAEIYGKNSLAKTNGNKDIIASNEVYNVQNFEKTSNIGGWNYNYSERTGEIHPNLPDEIYDEKVNWRKQ